MTEAERLAMRMRVPLRGAAVVARTGPEVATGEPLPAANLALVLPRFDAPARVRIVRGIQRRQGNRYVAQRIAQRKPVPTTTPTAKTASGWTTIVAQAKAALKKGNSSAAATHCRKAIVMAAGEATFPAGVTRSVPTEADIQLDLTSTEAHAQTRGSEVAANPTNYWRWIYFAAGTLKSTQAFTEAMVTHELIHVRQFQKEWQTYQLDTSADKPDWDQYRRRFNEAKRVRGPVELESELSGLAFLNRVKPDERDELLRGLFNAYVRSTSYAPPKGQTPPITTAAAKPLILDAFDNGDAAIKDQMGRAVWWSLLDTNAAKAEIRSVISDLGPVVARGYADTKLRPVYDDLLAAEGLRWPRAPSSPTKK